MTPRSYIENKWIDMIVHGVISGIMVFAAFALTSSETNSRELKKEVNNKADVSLVEEYRMQSKEYTDLRVDMVETKTQIELTNIANTQNLMYKFIKESMGDIKGDIKILKERD